MSKFEQSHPHHEVHEIIKPQGHGYIDQKYGKGNLSPIRHSVPQIESGSVPSQDPAASAAGGPGVVESQYQGMPTSGAAV